MEATPISKTNPLIIGITGGFSAGIREVAKILSACYGFKETELPGIDYLKLMKEGELEKLPSSKNSNPISVVIPQSRRRSSRRRCLCTGRSSMSGGRSMSSTRCYSQSNLRSSRSAATSIWSMCTRLQ